MSDTLTQRWSGNASSGVVLLFVFCCAVLGLRPNVRLQKHHVPPAAHPGVFKHLAVHTAGDTAFRERPSVYIRSLRPRRTRARPVTCTADTRPRRRYWRWVSFVRAGPPFLGWPLCGVRDKPPRIIYFIHLFTTAYARSDCIESTVENKCVATSECLWCWRVDVKWFNGSSFSFLLLFYEESDVALIHKMNILFFLKYSEKYTHGDYWQNDQSNQENNIQT